MPNLSEGEEMILRLNGKELKEEDFFDLLEEREGACGRINSPTCYRLSVTCDVCDVICGLYLQFANHGTET